MVSTGAPKPRRHVDGGAEVVHHRCATLGGERPDEEGRPAEAHDLHPRRPHPLADLDRARADLAPPEHDPAKAPLRAGVDHPLHRPARAMAV